MGYTAEGRSHTFLFSEEIKMERFVFENPTKVCFGAGCVREHLPRLLEPYETVMVCYGGGSIKKNGIYEEVISVLRSAGKRVTEFSGIMENPTYRKVLEGGRQAREQKAGLLLGIGGGSVMDCCKAVSMAARYDGDLWEDFWEKKGEITFEPLPLGVIVTVAGTGSECNGSAVITNEKRKVKTSNEYPECNAKFALLDPVYTYSVPVRQMAASGFDILSHVMETYFCRPDENNVSDDISEALMKSVISNLRRAVRNPEDYTARSNLLWDSTLAVNRLIKLGKQTDFMCHEMEHQLSAYLNCGHGAGLAVLHPAYYRYLCKAAPEKFARFAVEIWKISPEGRTTEELAEMGVNALEDFIRELELPVTLRELGAENRDELKKMADSCKIVPCSYRELTHETILEIFRACY